MQNKKSRPIIVNNIPLMVDEVHILKDCLLFILMLINLSRFIINDNIVHDVNKCETKCQWVRGLYFMVVNFSCIVHL